MLDHSYYFRAIPAEIASEFLFGQQYGLIENEKMTKGLYDKTFDTLFGLTNLGRFIPYLIPLLGSFFRMKLKEALGFSEPGAAVMKVFQVSRLELSPLPPISSLIRNSSPEVWWRRQRRRRSKALLLRPT